MMPKYRALAGRIRQELPALERVAQRAQSSLAAAAKSRDDRYIDAVALNLHAFYSGLERLFELIARNLDQVLPDGSSWHADLLAQMASPITDTRPPVISDALHARLDRFRGFRHVVRSVYSYNLDAEQIAVLVSELGDAVVETTDQLGSFAKWLDEVAGG